MFLSDVEAINWIENIKRKERRKDLSRMKECLKRLGNPEKSYESIHIAGTNGKGATALILSNILVNAGYNVGRFTSPYIESFHERIVFNEKPIDSKDLVNLSNQVYEVVKAYEKEHDDIVPFFEVVTLIGFLYFKMKNCEFAVIECGLGGLLDATNVIDSTIQIIPSIGYDHMNVLGNTLEEIATQKLGICKNNGTIITGVDSKLYPLFIDKSLKCGSRLIKVSMEDILVKSNLEGTTFYYKGFEYYIPLIGKFEALNAALAIEAAYTLLNITPERINLGMRHLYWPGRMQLIHKKPYILLDGAHNISAINTLIESLKVLFKDQKIDIIYTGLKDKDTLSIINTLKPLSNQFIITTMDDPRAKDPYLMKEESKFNDILVFEKFNEAYHYELNHLKEDEVLLITGSLHFVSYVLKELKLNKF